MHVSNFIKGYETQAATELVSQMKSNNDELVKKIDDLETKIVQQQSIADNSAEATSSIMIELNTKIAGLTADLVTKTMAIEKLQQTIEEKEALIFQMQENADRASEIITGLESTIKEKDDTIKEKDNTIAKLERDIEERTIMLNRTSAQLDKLVNKEENEANALKEMLKEISDKISSSTAEAKNALTSDQVGEIMDFIMHLNETYFQNIPLADEQFEKFVWNVPKRMYDSMMDQLERGEPDILNPMLLMYLSFVDEPGWTMGHFLTKLSEMIENDKDSVEYDNVEYLKSLIEDYEDDEEYDKVEYLKSLIDNNEEEETNDGQNESE